MAVMIRHIMGGRGGGVVAGMSFIHSSSFTAYSTQWRRRLSPFLLTSGERQAETWTCRQCFTASKTHGITEHHPSEAHTEPLCCQDQNIKKK